jgi:hypothetical protein
MGRGQEITEIRKLKMITTEEKNDDITGEGEMHKRQYQAPMAHTYNPSYSGGRGQED